MRIIPMWRPNPVDDSMAMVRSTYITDYASVDNGYWRQGQDCQTVFGKWSIPGTGIFEDAGLVCKSTRPLPICLALKHNSACHMNSVGVW